MAKVSFVRGTDAQIEELEVTEGQIIVSESGALYVDTDTERIPISASEETIVAVYDTTTATSAHAVDSYVYVNNYLYVVTVAIAVGDTIAVGTNVALATNLDANTPVYISGLPSSSGGDGGIPEGGTTGQVLVKLSNSDYDVGWGNATGGGVGTVVNIITTTPSFHNKTVTLTGTYATYSAVFDNTGHASVNVYYVGTYDIACEGFHNSVNVTAMGLVLTQGIDEDYCTVNITTSIADLEGETIDIYYGTDPTDIRAQLTFDSTLALSFRATQIGDYNIAWASTSALQTFTVSALSGSMSVTYTPIPIGASVTPVNDIRTWLNCAAIFDKNYTTISQVLSDTTTLQTLISSQNANDYLVRSTSWVSNVCGNSTAMSYIGLNNYSANTLLANSTWCTGICNSTYFESVLNVKVPTMTSNTTPSGECFAYGTRTEAGYQNYYLFDGNENQSWTSNVNGGYCGYEYPSAKKNYMFVFKYIFYYNRASGTTNTRLAKIQASNDGSNYTDLYVHTYTNPDGAPYGNVRTDTQIISAPNTYKYYRLWLEEPTLNGVDSQFDPTLLQFYGRQDV